MRVHRVPHHDAQLPGVKLAFPVRPKPSSPLRQAGASAQTGRIYIFAATEAPVAVLLRRKPTSLWHVALLRTDTGKLESGSWFRSMIYHQVCDLSPDGSLFVYHARGSRGAEWTAVCRPPSLEPLWHIPAVLTFGGGGAWIDNHTLVDFSGLKPEYIPQITQTQGATRKSRSPFRLIHYSDQRANDARLALAARRKAEADQATSLLPPGGPTPTSVAIGSKDRILVARQGAVEIWTTQDLKKGVPSKTVSLEQLQPPWQADDGTHASPTKPWNNFIPQRFNAH